MYVLIDVVDDLFMTFVGPCSKQGYSTVSPTQGTAAHETTMASSLEAHESHQRTSWLGAIYCCGP